jgi:hypothetical protein
MIYVMSKEQLQRYTERRFELEKMLGIKNPAKRFCGRVRTEDVAFTYRMGAGFVGDVNRTHPASIEPCLIDSNAPPTAYGQAVLVDATTQGVRPFTTTDNAQTDLYGVTVRPYPLQANTATPTLNSGTPPTTGVIDVLRSGYIMVVLGTGSLTGALKGGTVYIDCSASTGNYVLGGFQAAAGGQTVATMNGTTTFNGTQDSNGVCELSLHY